MDGRKDERKEGRKDGLINGWMVGRVDDFGLNEILFRHSSSSSSFFFFFIWYYSHWWNLASRSFSTKHFYGVGL